MREVNKKLNVLAYLPHCPGSALPSQYSNIYALLCVCIMFAVFDDFYVLDSCIVLAAENSSSIKSIHDAHTKFII